MPLQTRVWIVLAACSLVYSCKPTPPQWLPLGPYKVKDMLSYTDVGGKVDDIKVSDDYDGQGHAAIFIACGSTFRGDLGGGGIWRSTDFTAAQPTWTPLTDHVPGVADSRRTGINNIVTIAIEPRRQQHLWAGAGGAPLALLHSTDGGNQWTMEGLGQLGDNGAIKKVMVDPDRRIWVACTNGLYVSENNGTNFQHIDPVQFPGFTYSFDDIAWFSPVNGTLNIYSIYVGVVDNIHTSSESENQSGIWKVTGSAGHYSWTRMDITLRNIYGGDIKDTLIGSIRLNALQGSGAGIVASLGKRGDFTCPDPTGSIWGLLNVYKLTGQTWQPQWMQPAGSAGADIQGGYCRPLCLVPNGTIFAGGKGLAYTGVNNTMAPMGGKTQTLDGCTLSNFEEVTDKNGKIYHVDAQTIMYCRQDGNLYLGTDGGIIRFRLSAGSTGGVDAWASLNSPSLKNFLTLSMAYKAGEPYNILAGHQDNGVAHMSNNSWNYSGGNESVIVFFEPGGKSYFIDCSGGCTGADVSTDGGQHFNGHIDFPGEVRYSPALTFHPTQPGRMMLPCVPVGGSPRDAAVYESSNGFANASGTRKLPILNTGDHFYTTDINGEQAKALGYDAEGIACYVIPVWRKGLARLRRYYNAQTGDHFYTTNAAAENLAGYTEEANACSIYATQVTGTVALTRWYNPTSGDHFYTTDPAGEQPQKKGYTSEGITGYVYSAPQAGMVPLYRWYNHFRNAPTALCYSGATSYICVDGKVYQRLLGEPAFRVIFRTPGSIVSICANPTMPNQIFFATSQGKVFENKDAIVSPQQFEDISGSVTNDIITKLDIYGRPGGQPPILYAATQHRVARTLKPQGSATKWETLGVGLPDTEIRDMKVNPINHWVYVATFGRGIWMTIDTEQMK